MDLYFITGNKKKFAEIKTLIPDIKQLDIDLPELQEFDAHKIISFKLQQAFKHKKGKFIVEDTSLYMDCLNGLPGPLVRWFLEKLGSQGLYLICKKLKNNQAVARTIIGYAKDQNNIRFFEGELKGEIVSPRGNNQFGWNDIFRPEGFTKTFAQMSQKEKVKISMRTLATLKLKNFLDY